MYQYVGWRTAAGRIYASPERNTDDAEQRRTKHGRPGHLHAVLHVVLRGLRPRQWQGPGETQLLGFSEVAKAFKIIDTETTAVLVPYGDGRETVERLLGDPEAVVTPDEQRRMQRFTVGLYENELRAAKDAGLLLDHASGVVVFRGEYDPVLGRRCRTIFQRDRRRPEP